MAFELFIKKSPLRAFGLSVFAIAASTTALPIAWCDAQPSATASPRAIYPRPDVQVLIAPAGGSDMVDLTYRGVVPPAQAERDVTAILHAGGWHTTDVDISNDALSVQGAADVPMTSVTFETAGISPPPGATTVPVEPWIVGLRAYRDLAITYMMPPAPQFSGLQSYQDSHIQLALDQEQSNLTYHVRVLDGGRFTSLGLPLTQADAQARAAQGGRSGRGRLKLIGIIAIGLLAAGVGYAVYMLLSRLH